MSVIVKDGVWKKIKAQLSKLDHRHVKVGVLSNADHDGIGMIELAAIHEFGSPAAGIPERSFIRRTFEEKEEELKAITEKVAEKVVTGKMPTEKALEIIGQWASTAIKKTITEGDPIPPPLKPATIARKGSDRPLVDTGQLVGSITYKVET